MTTIPKLDTPVDTVVDVQHPSKHNSFNWLLHTGPYVYIIIGVAFAGLTAGLPLFGMTVGVATLSFLIREVLYDIQCYRYPDASLEQRIAFAKASWLQNLVIHSSCLLWGLSCRPAHAAFSSFTSLANQLFPNATLLIELFVGAILLLMVGTIMISVIRALLAHNQDQPFQHLLMPCLYVALGYAVIETASLALL
ncbi:MAG: hypothetical protein AAF959_01675 [Cyanobacteria bacterium P01_D01_bin.56]